MSQVLGRYGADDWMSGIIYTAVVQMVLLYGSESWVMSPRIGKAMGIIHHREIRRLTGQMPHLNRYGTWTYLPLGPETAEENLQKIENYATRLQKTVA